VKDNNIQIVWHQTNERTNLVSKMKLFPASASLVEATSLSLTHSCLSLSHVLLLNIFSALNLFSHCVLGCLLCFWRPLNLIEAAGKQADFFLLLLLLLLVSL